MKSFIMALTVLCFSTAIFAAEVSDPVSEYLNNPDHTKFGMAVESALDSLAMSSNPNLHKLKLAYITEQEVSILLSDLQSSKAELTTGELFSLANLYLGRSEYGDAIALYDSLNSAYPNWSCPWRHKGEAYYRLKKYNEASTALQQAITTNVNHYDAYIWLALTQKELGQYSAALKNLDKARELSPDAEQSEDKVLSQEQVQSLYQELQKLMQ